MSLDVAISVLPLYAPPILGVVIGIAYFVKADRSASLQQRLITSAFGPSLFLLFLCSIAIVGVMAAMRLWRSEELTPVHAHPDLPQDHPHLKEHGGRNHAHVLYIDELHPRWPN